jgi:hypothetical protein
MFNNENGSSNIIKPRLINIECGLRMVIYEKELLVYAKTNHIVKIFAVFAGTKDKAKWQLEFQLKGQKERALLVSQTNKPRLFPRLNNMVEMLTEWCPDLEYVSVDMTKN